MPEVATEGVNEKEVYEKKIMRCMDSWRELVLVVKTVLLWDKPSYPWILLIATSLLFLEIAHLEPTLMTAICMVGLFFVLLDYSVPLMCDSFWKQESWTATKQRELESTCRALAATIFCFINRWRGLIQMKHTKPSSYYAIMISCLLVMAWIGSTLNNLFLTYLLVLGVLMAPGLIYHGYADKWHKLIFTSLSQLIRGVSSSKAKTQ